MKSPEERPTFTPDQAAAQQFLTELRTRISTQPLPYQYGVEARALTSMWEVFDQARDAIKKNPGCEEFADKTTHVLNVIVRPLTGKWDRALEEGRLHGRDGADQFRGELQEVQKQLREFAAELQVMAYGKSHADELTPEVMSDADLRTLLKPLAFGIPPGCGIEEGVAPAIDATEGHPDYYGSGAKGINTREAHAVAKRREVMQVSTACGKDGVGLAFSGGGIRSATFCLGVTQVLAERKLLKDVDFLSTVSGGGYVGSFLTRQIGEGGEWEEVAAPHGPDTEPIRRLRQRAKFLTARSLWAAWGMVTSTVAGLLMNWTVPLLVLTTLAAVTVHVTGLERSFAFWRWPLYIGLGISVVAVLAYFRLLRAGKISAKRAGWCFAAAVAVCLTALVGLALTGTFGILFFPCGYKPWPDPGSAIDAVSRSSLWSKSGFAGLSLGATAALVPVVLRYVPLLERPAVRVAVTKVALVVAGIFVPLLGIAVFFTLYAIGRIEKLGSFPVLGAINGEQALWILAALLTLVAILVLNINLTGPHRLYRNGLSKTFVERDENKDMDFPLKDLNPKGTAPYHLINVAANLPSSQTPFLRERKCDFFLFSKYWSGSPVVGYQRTKDWMMNGKPADLATAMAISGAAFSANMGLGSIAPLRALLAFLNVRLGFWIRQPQIGGLWGLKKWNHPGFLCLLREMGGVGMAENHRWLNLSDGGHIENLAVYELLRRRCKFIVCVDGESDPMFTFQGLMTLVRHAQIDFGVRIDAKLDDFRLDPKTGYSKCHFHLCRIHYPEGVGLLLYIKLSVTGNESELIRRYRINNPNFPHETTLDQFFDQEQFEAYRQLGVHAAEALFLPALISGAQPTSVPEWFRQLAKNLLEPIKT
jgi:hypothetical protein